MWAASVAASVMSLAVPAGAFQCYGYTTVSTSNSAVPPYLPANECEGCRRTASRTRQPVRSRGGGMLDSPRDCKDALNYAEPIADYDAEGRRQGGGAGSSPTTTATQSSTAAS